MIGIDELALTFSLSDLIGNRDIQTKEAWVKGADVNLRDETPRRLNVDDWVIKIAELFASESSTNQPAEAGAFSIDQITLLESKFSISDSSRDSVKNGFDYNHFQLVDLNADLLNLKAVADTFQIDVKYLSTRDSASNLTIDELKTFFRNSQKGMAFYGLDLRMGKTHIKDEVVFNHDRPGQMGYFVDSVYIEANFDKTLLHTDELSYFVPEFKQYNELVKIDGFFEGNVRRFFSDNFRLDFGEQTILEGILDIEGLPNVDQTIFDIKLKNSKITAQDFIEYIGNRTFDITSKLGLVEVDGLFFGDLDVFVANGDFKTEIGSFTSNTQITVEQEALPYYKGKLEMDDFDLGLFTGDSVFQKVDMNGTIEGYGFTLEDANFTLDAQVPRIGIYGYEYQNIQTNGEFEQSFFKGKLDVSDPNLKLNVDGSIDLRDNKQRFEIEGVLDTAQLNSINLSKESIALATNFSIDVTGIKLDSILGNIYLTETYLKYRENDIVFDSLLFSSRRDFNERSVRFISEDQFEVELDGDFEFTSLLNEAENINEQYRLIFSSRMQEVDKFIIDHKPLDEKFNIRYKVSLPNVSPVLQLFDTSLYISPMAELQGRFGNLQGEELALSAQADTVKWANIRFVGNELDINSTDFRDASKVQTLGFLRSDKQLYANTSETDSLSIQAIWEGTEIRIQQDLKQESSGNRAEISANINFFPDSTILRFNDSELIALNETWRISEDNKVTFGEKRIDVENLRIENIDQSISFAGEVAVTKDSSKTLGIQFKDVSIANLDPLTSKSYTGKLNGSLSAQNLYFNPILYGQVSLNELRVNKFLVGDVDGSLTWNDFNKKFDLNFEVDRLNKKIISLKGDFFPSRDTNQLDLSLLLNDANLNIAEPFIDEYFSEIDGFINGDYKVSGTIRAPVIKGMGSLNNGNMKVNYLNTSYNFNGGVEFKKDSIKLSRIAFTDVRQNPAEFNGSISHNSFNNFRLDLLGSLNKFQVLDLPENLSEVYYGTAYASGSVNLIGEASNLNIEADVTTDENTRLFIPISEGTDETDNPDYITFIDRTDTTQVDLIAETDEVVDKIKIEGLKLDLNIDVTPDAYVEIIIDPKSGDIIRGRGNGQLRLEIDTQGEFQMTGGMNIVEGAYNFSLYNFITKEFQIEQPSTITWYGDPYTGVMDINGSYSQNTSLQPILEQTGFASPVNEGNGGASASRRFPTKVLLGLKGLMLSPEITFDIDFSEIQGQENQVAINAFKNRLQSDEQELNRQVLSLIVLNRFSDQGGLTIGGNTTSQNVSQLLSNQLSQLVAQLDDNLEVDFDLADLDQDAFNTFQLRLSYTFLNGRLRVTREGGLANLVDINSIAGDWTAEYLLTEDGRYKIKVYSRSNYDITNLASSPNATTNTTGASVTQTTSFNNLKEFFSGVNRKRRKRKDKNE